MATYMKNSQAGREEFLNSNITTFKLFVAFSENHKLTLKIVCAFLCFDMGSCLLHTHNTILWKMHSPYLCKVDFHSPHGQL